MFVVCLGFSDVSEILVDRVQRNVCVSRASSPLLLCQQPPTPHPEELQEPGETVCMGGQDSYTPEHQAASAAELSIAVCCWQS